VPKAVQAEVLNAQKQIAKGKLHPFSAKESVLDNEGREAIAKGQTLSDEQILGMNWLAAGVQGKISH
jgi:simple sugar transport system substrate-binding protein